MRRADPGPVVVWRLGDALLAVELDAVEAVVSVDTDGRARTRAGLLEITTPPGLDSSGASRHAVVLLRCDGEEEARIALAADEVEGVVEPDDASAVDPPEWLASVESAHLRALVPLADRRVAALLEVAALFQRS